MNISLKIYNAGYTDKPLYFTQIGFSIIPQGAIAVKCLLTIINSKLINFYHKYRFLDLEKELFQKILIASCKCFPIKSISPSAQQPFIDIADKMLTLNTELQTKRQRFHKRLSDNIEGIKITRALEQFDTLEFKEFVNELAKQKITLSLPQQDEWEEYFTPYQTECSTLVAQINTADQEIDRMVYELYGLTEEEIGIVEGE